MKRLLLARRGRLLLGGGAAAGRRPPCPVLSGQQPGAAAASMHSSASRQRWLAAASSASTADRQPHHVQPQQQQQPVRGLSKFKGGSLREKAGLGSGGKHGKAGGSKSVPVIDDDGGLSMEELLEINPDKLELPPGTNTENMSLEEMKTLSDAYLLEKASRKKQGREEVLTKPDLRHVYAASNDPADHVLSKGKGGGGTKVQPGTVYTIPEAEYKKYFPGPWTKPSRVPFENGLQQTLATRFLLLRPPALEVIEGLRAFAEGRFPKAAEAEALREAWQKKGGLGSVALKKAGEAAEAAPEPSTAAAAAAAADEGAGEGEEEKAAAAAAGEGEGEEEDEYDLFGEEEDEEEDSRKAGAAGRKEEEEAGGAAGQEKKRDSEIFGTLRRLAVDDATLVHPEQTLELPLTPPPAPGANKDRKSIFLLSGPRGVGKTAALYHAVHYARRQGWVVLLVPSAYEYLHEGGLVRPSPFFKGLFDTPDLAQTTLRQLGEAHGHQLAVLPAQDAQALARLGLPKGSTLVDLVALGLAKRKLATTALLELKRELEAQKTYPFLVAIDEYSEWFHPSTYQFAQKKVESSRLAVVKALRDLVPTDPKTAGGHHPHMAVLAARSEKFPRWDRKKAMKGQEGRKRLSDLPSPLPARTPYDVPVAKYSAEEFEAVYKFVADSGLWGTFPSLDPATVTAARVATASHPETFAKDATALQARVFAPQNRVGKASAHAPKDFMLSEIMIEIERGEAMAAKLSANPTASPSSASASASASASGKQ